MLGEIFKNKREELGFSLREVSDNLRIQHEYLKALEENNLKKLPPEVYTRGYIRDYARLLDLDAKPLLEEYSESLSIKEPPARPDVPTPPKVHRTSPLMIGAFLALAAAFTVYFFYPQDKTYSPPLPAPSLSPANTAPPQVQEKNLPQDQDKAPLLQEKPVAATREKRTHKLSVIAFEETWLYIETGSGNTEEVILQKGDTKEWSSPRGFTLKLGNAGGVKVIFNEKDLGPLGQHGHVVKLVLPAQGQE